jgi:adenine-specific DNA-methyltransferase
VATDADHRVLRGEALNVASTVEVDLAYFDPPYGSNNEKMPPSRVRYSSYYHVWTSVCLFDKPKLFGKARRREDSSDMVAPSVFEDYRKNPQGGFIAVDAIDRLLGATRARWIILSYSSGGRATARDLDDVIRRNGQLIEALEIDYKRNVMASMKWTNKWLRDAEQPNREFLFLIERSSARQTPAAASATTALAVNEQPRRADRTS